MLEHRGDGGQLGPREVQRRVVDDVEDDQTIGPQDPVDVAERLARGQVPRHGDPAERVADVDVVAVGAEPLDGGPPVGHLHLEPWVVRQGEPGPVDLDHPGVDLDDPVRALRTGGQEVARQGHPAAADVQHRERPGRPGVHGGGEGLHVGELEVGRVARVDVAVPQRVEHQRPALRTGRVGDDRRAVVPRLDLARRRDEQRAEPRHQREHERRGHPDVRRDSPPPVGHDERQAADDEQAAGPEEDHAGRHVRHEDEPGEEGREDRAQRADPGQPADHRPGLGRRRQDELDHHRRYRGEHRRRRRTR